MISRTVIRKGYTRMALDFVSISGLVSEFVFDKMKESLLVESGDYCINVLHEVSLKEMFYDAIAEFGADQLSSEKILENMRDTITEGVVDNITNDKEYLERCKDLYKIVSGDIIKDIIKTFVGELFNRVISVNMSNAMSVNANWGITNCDFTKYFHAGDVIGVERAFGFYSHYGIYAGDGKVIHYASPRIGAVPAKVILETDFCVFLQGIPFLTIIDFINFDVHLFHESNSIRREKRKTILPNQNKVKLYSPEDTILRARSRLYDSRYDLVNNNCEHFVIWCKTGLCTSRDVEHVFAIVHKRRISLENEMKYYG